MSDYIPLDECKHGHVYRINARNFGVGVFNEKDNGFIGIRYKLGSRFLDTEHHWDQGPPHGTVKPLGEVHALPEDIPVSELNNKQLFDWLDKLELETEE
jgi:hypothetical protein